jgi:single-stranded DNA-specific DHH superfamily exonuclease
VAFLTLFVVTIVNPSDSDGVSSTTLLVSEIRSSFSLFSSSIANYVLLFLIMSAS